MPTDVSPTGGRLLPVLRYRDVAGAIDWLGTAFGFSRLHVVTDDRGGVRYAVLNLDGSLIMLGPVRDSDPAELMRQPDEIGGAETQSCYFVVDDAAAHYARAKAAGADIVFDIREYDFGGRGYSCRDPEGHIWTFGTYDPWRVHALRGAGWKLSPLLAGGIAALLVTVGVAGWLAGANDVPRRFDSGNVAREALVDRDAAAATAAAELEQERAARLSAERAALAAHEELDHAHEETKAAEQKARSWERRLLQARLKAQRAGAAMLQARNEREGERGAIEASERSLQQARDELHQERRAKEAAQQSAQSALADAKAERSGKEASERSLQQVRDELQQERRAKETAQRSAQSAMKDTKALRTAKEASERGLQRALGELQKEQRAREAAQSSAQGAAKDVAAERSGKEAAQKLEATLREQLVAERRAREAAEKAAEAARSRLAELQEAKPVSTKATQDASPQPPPKPKQVSKPQSQPQPPAASRSTAEPIPALVP